MINSLSSQIDIKPKTNEIPVAIPENKINSEFQKKISGLNPEFKIEMDPSKLEIFQIRLSPEGGNKIQLVKTNQTPDIQSEKPPLLEENTNNKELIQVN